MSTYFYVYCKSFFEKKRFASKPMIAPDILERIIVIETLFTDNKSPLRDHCISKKDRQT